MKFDKSILLKAVAESLALDFTQIENDDKFDELGGDSLAAHYTISSYTYLHGKKMVVRGSFQ